MLDAHFARSDDADERWWVFVEKEVAGTAFARRVAATDRVWELTMLTVRPADQGRGFGRALIRHVEMVLRAARERLLVVQTSGSEAFTGARRFYRRLGYAEEARVRDFWADGDDMIILSKRLDDG
jgi:ribosomal protein S18 acetylase RimI-like enzyme